MFRIAPKTSRYDKIMTYTLATGTRACSKTTLLSLLHRLFHNGAVIMADTSDIINLHIKRKTPIGVQLEEFNEQKKSGKILPCDELVFEAIKQWVHAKSELQNVLHVLLAGSPRSPKQCKLWKEHTPNLRVINIHAEPHEIEASVIHRQKITQAIRPDESPESLRNAWQDYKNLVVPGLKVFNGQAKTILRSQPMRVRLKETIDHIDVPENVRYRLHQRLDTPNHPVSMDVDKLDGVTV